MQLNYSNDAIFILLKVLTIIIKQILSFFGHVMRRDVSLEKAIMLGKCDGTRRRGRPRQR